MARMPAANWLGEHSPRNPMQRYDIVCVHTIVGFAPAHAAHFSTHAGGRIDQSRDTRFQSGANLNGNHRVIAIENEDHGGTFGNWNVNDGHQVPAMTTEQVEACAKILAWAHKTHGIPLQLCPDSKPGSRGLAYHRQGIDGNFKAAGYRYPGRVSGGEVWTTSPGKVCPGDRRISQLPDILDRAKQIVTGEDDVTPEDIQKIAAAVWNAGIGPEGSVESARERLRGADFQATEANTKITGVAEALEALRVGERNRFRKLREDIQAIAADTTESSIRRRLEAVTDSLEES